MRSFTPKCVSDFCALPPLTASGILWETPSRPEDSLRNDIVILTYLSTYLAYLLFIMMSFAASLKELGSGRCIKRSRMTVYPAMVYLLELVQRIDIWYLQKKHLREN